MPLNFETYCTVTSSGERRDWEERKDFENSRPSKFENLDTDGHCV